ncbi:4'-phosphopantetheinyl transferase superfamily protein [Priestia filamentosa]|uniref:4'-phosphopantetheinyl transferase family protein n=1 Tax=Priestia filamentosa TaxID=1402861 RepID=UPI003D2A5AC6
MQIHLLNIDYCCDFNNYKSFYPILDKEIRQKISKFVNEDDKIRSFLSHLFLRYLISCELRCELVDIKFKYGKYGKPYIDSGRGLAFNISHSGKFIAIAIDMESEEIGVDIQECIKLDYKELASSFFTQQEYEYITCQSNIKRNFFRIWTLKESYLKAIGSGLYAPLNSICFSSINNNIKPYFEKNNKTYYFHSEFIPPIIYCQCINNK